MSRSFFSCHRTYFRICSSSRPTVLTQYPFAQKCRPQYRFFNWMCRSNILIALLPFRNPTTSDTEYLGEIDRTKWIWSICTLPSSISTFFHWHNCRIISRTDVPTSPQSTRNRYFGHHNTWYLHSQTACASLLKSDTEYLLSMFRVTHPHPKEVFLYHTSKSLTYTPSIAWTTGLAGGFMHLNKKKAEKAKKISPGTCVPAPPVLRFPV